jgi:RNA polymerase sigma-70 factor (ECF subfamily)
MKMMSRPVRPVTRPRVDSSLRAGVPLVAPAQVLSDLDLVDRAQGGDRWAEEMIYRRHVPYVGWLVIRLMGRQDDAEDVVQEIFATALEQLRTLRDGAALRAWLTQIAVSRAGRRLQRRRLMRLVGLDRGADDATLAALVSNDCSPEIRAELGLIADLLARLPGKVRIAWMLHCVEGLTLEEVAEACRCSLATTKRRIVVAEVRLQKFVAPPPSEKQTP